MGDRRFDRFLDVVKEAGDPALAMRTLTDEEVVFALGAASRENDPYWANVLATEAANRARRTSAALSITEHLGEGVCAIDRDGLVVFVNPMAEALWGWTRDELVGTRLHDAVHRAWPDGSDRTAESCELLGVMRSREPVRMDDVFLCKDGTFLPVSYTASPVLEDGEPDGAVIVFRNIVDPPRARAALMAADGRRPAPPP